MLAAECDSAGKIGRGFRLAEILESVDSPTKVSETEDMGGCRAGGFWGEGGAKCEDTCTVHSIH